MRKIKAAILRKMERLINKIIIRYKKRQSRKECKRVSLPIDPKYVWQPESGGRKITSGVVDRDGSSVKNTLFYRAYHNSPFEHYDFPLNNRFQIAWLNKQDVLDIVEYFEPFLEKGARVTVWKKKRYSELDFECDVFSLDEFLGFKETLVSLF